MSLHSEKNNILSRACKKNIVEGLIENKIHVSPKRYGKCC